MRSGRRQRRADGVAPFGEPGEVVVLDQDRIVEPDPVIPAAAAADGILLQRPPARGGLAGIEDDGPGARDLGDEPRGQGGDPTEPLEEVQGRAFQGQQRPYRASHPCDHGPRRHAVAVADERLPEVAELEAPGQDRHDRQTRDHPLGPRHEPRHAAGLARDRDRRGQVAGLAEVLGQRQVDQLFGFATFRGPELGTHGVARHVLGTDLAPPVIAPHTSIISNTAPFVHGFPM